MSKSAPAPPDYAGAAQAQADASREVTEQQTWANRPTINTPFGQQTWEVTPQWDPSTGQYLNTWTQNTNLTPESQAALDSQMRLQQGRSNLAEGLLGRTQQEYGDTMDWNKFQELQGAPDVQQYGASPDVPTYTPENIQRSVGNADPYYNQAGDAIFNQWASRNEPQFEKDTAALRTQLYNQGLKEGDAGYDEGMRKLRESQTDARNQASYQATIGAGQEAQRMQGMDISAGGFANQAAAQALQQQLGIGGQQFNQNLARTQLEDSRGSNTYNQEMQNANYGNQLRQQQIAEEMQRRGFSLNEINAILSGQQVSMPSMPSFNTANRSEGLQALSAAQMQGQAALDAFNAQQQATQGTLSGLAGGAMMFSDRRLKKNVTYLETREDGIPVYKFNYIWEDPDQIASHIGLMAQDVIKIYPDAVVKMHDYLMVDYGRLP